MVRVCQDLYPNKANPEKAGFYMDDTLKAQLDIALINIVDDWDFTILITGSGEVRVGKSLLGLQICVYWVWALEKKHGIKIPFDVKENLVFQWDKLIEQGNKLGEKYPYSPLQYDEAGETMEGIKSATSELKAVRDFLRECGQYNFLNILVLPEFFDLPKGIALTRSTFLIDVTYTADQKTGKFVRGYFKFYSRAKKKKLYLKGKKELNYNAVPYNFQGRFYKFYPVDEESYRAKKKEALRERESGKKDKVKMMFGALIFMLTKLGYTQVDIRKQVEELTRGFAKLPESTCKRYVSWYNDYPDTWRPTVQPR